MIGTPRTKPRRSRGPAERLARKIERKQGMVEEYERIARETDVSTSSGRAMQEYFLKRAADFRAEKNRMEAHLQILAARSRGPRQSENTHPMGVPPAPESWT